MRFADQYRLYPTRAPARFLEGQLREACPLYKAAQQERDDACKTCRQSIHSYDPANQSKANALAKLSGGVAPRGKNAPSVLGTDPTRRAARVSAIPPGQPLRQDYVPVLRRRLPFAGYR